MKRAYWFGAALFGAALIVVIIALLTNPITIPDAPAASLEIDGRLLLAESTGISTLDLATGQLRPIFTAEPGGQVTAAMRSPDGQLLALAYAPPAGLIQFGYTNLYVLPADGSGMLRLLVDGHQRDVIAGPVWAADGRSIVYYRSAPSANGLSTERSVERVALDGGDPQVVVPGAFSPDLSRDGARLAYIASPDLTSPDHLTAAGVDGSGAVTLAGEQQFLTIDRPRFSPDGRWIVFSADEAPKVRAARIDWAGLLGGVRVASAHTIPTNDLWRIAAAGGAPVRLLFLQADGVAADYSPDGTHIAVIGSSGLVVMNADGSGAVRIDHGHTFTSVEWLRN